jgi:hypothetical protein
MGSYSESEKASQHREMPSNAVAALLLLSGRDRPSLSPRMIHMIEDLFTDWRHLDRRIETVPDEIKTLSDQDNGAKRLMTVPGIGPIISTATVAAIGSGEAFSNGRDFGAWLGLVPRRCRRADAQSSGQSPSAAVATCECYSSRQPEPFYCARKAGRGISRPDGDVEIVGRWAYASSSQEANHETRSDHRAACDSRPSITGIRPQWWHTL